MIPQGWNVYDFVMLYWNEMLLVWCLNHAMRHSPCF
jgi:hypothetical protein